MDQHNKINYLEIPVQDLLQTKTFLAGHLAGILWIMGRNIAVLIMLASREDSTCRHTLSI